MSNVFSIYFRKKIDGFFHSFGIRGSDGCRIRKQPRGIQCFVLFLFSADFTRPGPRGMTFEPAEAPVTAVAKKT